MYPVPSNISAAEIEALHLPDDLALVHAAIHRALEAALLLKSFGRYAEPDAQQLSFFFRVIYSLHEDRLPAAKKALEPVRRDLILAHHKLQCAELPIIAGITGDCGHATALALAEDIFHRACLYEGDAERWQGPAAVKSTEGQESRRVILANAVYLPGGGIYAAGQWQCIHPRLAVLPTVDEKLLTALMKKEIVLAASQRHATASIILSPWQIDQLRPFADVIVPHLSLPVTVSEEKIKECFTQLFPELTKHGDWAGEKFDVLANCSVDGQTRVAAFLLKGPSVKKPMQIRDCGKNGDQILKLVQSPAQVFVIQHVHQIEESARSDLQQKIPHFAQRRQSCSMLLH